MPAAVYILFGAALTYFVSLALGKLLLRRLSVPLYREEEYTLGFVAGSACLSFLLFLTAAAGLARKGVFLALGLAIVGAALWTGVHRPVEKRLPALPLFWRLIFVAVTAVYFYVYFFNAMAPEMSPDGSTYHLGLVRRYLSAHGFVPITTNVYASLSQGIELLYMYAFSFGKHSAAALVHFSFLATMPFLMLSYARRFGFPVAGVGGAIFFFVSPMVGRDGTTAYNDVATATILFALFYLLQIWDSERHSGFFVPIGLLAGFAYTAKYTTFLAVPYALGFIAWKARRIRPLVIVSLCALVLIVPWLAKNWIVVQNPFAPFLNKYIPNPYVHLMFDKEYNQFMRTYGLKSRWEIPRKVTIDGADLSGLLGPLFLLAPVSLLALRRPQGRQLLLAGFLFLLTYPANIGTRFLISPLPFFSLAMALAVAAWWPVLLILVVAHSISAWPRVMPRYCSPYAWRLTAVPVKAALRRIPEDRYLSEKFWAYRYSRMIDRDVPVGKRVMTMIGIPEAYTGREIWVRFQSASNELLSDIFDIGMTPDFQPTLIQDFHFASQALRKVRVVQTATCPPDEQWAITETRVYSAGAELPRLPEWRLTAHPNPWDVQLAFDDSPVTRWRTWDTTAPGDYVEIDFGKLQPADQVRIETSTDHWNTRIKLEGMDASGKWIQLSGKPSESRVKAPGGLRQLATLEMKARGVDYLLLNKDDYGAEDVRDDPEAWGLRLIEDSGGEMRLYRLEK